MNIITHKELKTVETQTIESSLERKPSMQDRVLNHMLDSKDLTKIDEETQESQTKVEITPVV